jgi:hypothetical protein
MIIVPRAPMFSEGREYVDWLTSQPPLRPLAVKQAILLELALRPRQSGYQLNVSINNGTNGAGVPYLTRPAFIYRAVTGQLQHNASPDAASQVGPGTLYPALSELETDRSVITHEYVANPIEGRPDRKLYMLSKDIGGIAVPAPSPVVWPAPRLA